MLKDSEGQGSLACCSPRGCRAGCDSVTEQQQGPAARPEYCTCLNVFSVAAVTNCHKTEWFKTMIILFCSVPLFLSRGGGGLEIY